jgi:hypothetical protein
MSQAQVVTIAVDRIYQQEVTTVIMQAVKEIDE